MRVLVGEVTCGEEEELLLHELAVVEQHLPEVVDGLVPRPVPVIHHHLQQYSTVQYSTVPVIHYHLWQHGQYGHEESETDFLNIGKSTS